MSNGRELDDWVDSFVNWTDNSESPMMYRLWTGISVVASALRRKCSLSWGSLTFYPNMYIVLVGPSGCRKGTAMGPGEKLLKWIPEVKLAATSTTRQALIRRLQKSTDTITLEDGKQSFHSSLTIFSEEFTVFLGYQNNELMADLCDWFDCKEHWIYETKNMGTDEIIGVWVNIIGATTPTLVRSSLPMDSIGGGLTSRMIFVCEEKKEKTVIFPNFDDNLQTALGQDLERISMMKGRFKVTQPFLKLWTKWYTEISHNPNPFGDPRFEGYADRRPTHVMKLALILSASRGNNINMVVTDGDLERAIAILTRTEVKMPMVFGGVGRSELAPLMEQVIGFIRNKRELTRAELMQRFYYDADSATMQRVLDTLIEMDYIQSVHNATGPTIIRWSMPEPTTSKNDIVKGE